MSPGERTAMGPDDMHLVGEVERRLDTELRPLIHMHAGDLVLESVVDGIVKLRFRGACRGCPFRPNTLMTLVRPRLLQVPGVRDVEIEGLTLAPHVVRVFEELVESQRVGGGQRITRGAVT